MIPNRDGIVFFTRTNFNVIILPLPLALPLSLSAFKLLRFLRLGCERMLVMLCVITKCFLLHVTNFVCRFECLLWLNIRPQRCDRLFQRVLIFLCCQTRNSLNRFLLQCSYFG